MQIGNLTVGKGAWLAPMAGVTGHAFRTLCRQNGAALCYTEMISAKGLCYGNEQTIALLNTDADDQPLGVQIFGKEPQIMARATEYLCHQHQFQMIDINMGCPAQKIIKNGEGSALMQDMETAKQVIRAVVGASSLPVSVKIRKGWDEAHINAVAFARMAEGEGVSAIAVHGRTRTQQYSGKADWDIIAQVKQAVDIPVIGNGDVNSVESAVALAAHTGCDAVMIGRGALGNPWLFLGVLHFLQTGQAEEVTVSPEIRVQAALNHAQKLMQELPERVAVCEMRKHVAWYIKGTKGAAQARQQINHAQTFDDLKNGLSNYLKQLT